MDTTTPEQAAFDAVIRAVGSPKELQTLLGETHLSAVCNWRERGFPPNKVKAIERLTGISVKALRPKDWQEYWPDPVKATKPAKVAPAVPEPAKEGA
jgi:DNA-binding transcriptional regulator YdaS (Cro superfamily)